MALGTVSRYLSITQVGWKIKQSHLDSLGVGTLMKIFPSALTMYLLDVCAELTTVFFDLPS